MFFVEEGFTFRNFLMDALAIFVLIVWFWLLITIASDLFRRHDISGWAKALWVIALVVVPYIAVFAYLIFQGRGVMFNKRTRYAKNFGARSALVPQMKSRNLIG
jgi:hypothetical protein